MINKDIKILLVDDEPDILEIISYNLTAQGYTVFTANNGQKAIKRPKRKASAYHFGCDDARNGWH